MTDATTVKLEDFRPDPDRAAFLNRRLAGNLATSIGEIARACQGKLDFDQAGVARTCAAIAGKDAVATVVYTTYFDLMNAARRSDAEELRRLFGRLTELPLDSRPLHVVRWGDPSFDPALQARYLDYVNMERSATPVVFEELPQAQFEAVSGSVDEAFALLEAGAPEIAGEIRELVRELVLVGQSDDPNAMRFDGATSFHCWGALFLNADQHADAMEMVDGLAHESAHSHLFGVSLGDPFVTNPREERHRSPLRVDPRPLDGIFHATYVSARMHYAHHRLLGARLLSGEQAAVAEKGRATGKRAFFDGLATLDAHARLTPLGARVLDGARSYMAPFA